MLLTCRVLLIFSYQIAYDAANSSYEIADDAASVLADTGTVVDAGVSGVVVADATGSGYVSASDGVALSSIDFGSLTGVLSNELQAISKLYDSKQPSLGSTE